ncbi:sugar transferase [Actinomyces timonensis]|uniref:Sugar transferase n=1 Tax=Actinomyces timonensis TaxID=1288391 RepID=A0AAU8N4P1_9ACTO
MIQSASLSAFPTASEAWRRRAFFRRGLRAGDIAIILLVVACVERLCHVTGREHVGSGVMPALVMRALLITAVAVTWGLLLTKADVYRDRVLGHGATEYKRVVWATVLEFAGFSILGYMVGVRLPTAYLVSALAISIVALLAWHWAARRRLIRLAAAGSLAQPAYVVGSAGAVASAIDELTRQPGLGLQIRGAFVSDAAALDGRPGLPVPVIGEVGSLQETVESSEGIAVVVAEDSGLTSAMIRRLSQSLGAEGRLIMLPPLLQIASSRLWMRSDRGLSAIEIQQPRVDVAHSPLKRSSDIFASLLIIVLLVPVWLIVPPLIWMQDRGPILFRQTRIGLNGKPFKIWKFRSMRINADAELAGLLREQNRTGSPLFKVDNDPRITRVGAFLRRTSIDELPQLFNVLAGSMSLVGPRPQVAKEVELYDEEAARRLLAKPGITGLWQVSGRSSLTWEEAIRLDLFYVDNWTPGMDLWILLRTVKAVLLLDGSA